MTMTRDDTLKSLGEILHHCSFFLTAESERWQRAEYILIACDRAYFILNELDLSGSPKAALFHFVQTLKTELSDAELEQVIPRLREMIESGRDELARDICDLEGKMADFLAKDKVLRETLGHELFSNREP